MPSQPGRKRLVAVLAVVAAALLSGPAHAQYVERHASWSVGATSTWQVKDLSGAPFTVAADAVVEVAIVNTSTTTGRSGGVRAVGSSLERRIAIDEAKNGGSQVVVMHVQADASGRIECYAEHATDVTLYVLGFWTSGTYVELFPSLITATTAASWHDLNLAPHGVATDTVAEVLLALVKKNKSPFAGVRANGSTLDRRFELGRVEADGFVSGLTLFAQADDTANATVEIYTEQTAEALFQLLGYWSTPPTRFTERMVDLGAPSSDSTWEDRNLTAEGVSGRTIVEIAVGNGNPQNKAIGIRENGSAAGRTVDLQGGGGAFARMHVPADTSAVIEWYTENNSGADIHLTGCWSSGRPLLLVVVDPASLTAQEAARKALLESFGYLVTLIDESDLQTNYDAAFATHDVVYVSEEVSSASVGTKLTNAPIGVVFEEAELVDEMRIATSRTWPTGSAIDVLVGDHYITSPFGAGSLSILSSGQSVVSVSGDLGQQLTILANWGAGESTLSLLEAGARRQGGGYAAHRCVQLPWGGGPFDVNQLNANGQTVMQRSVDWAAALVAHWKLDDGSGTTAVDSLRDNDGTLTNGPTWTSGPLAGALDFDGVDAHVNVPADDALDFTGDFSVSLWFRLDADFDSSSPTTQILCEKYGDDDHDFLAALVGTDYGSGSPADGSIVAKIENGAGGDVYRYTWTTRTSWTAGRWYHVVIAGDGADATNNKLYVNGVDETSGTGVGGTGGNAIDLSFAADFRIGGRDADTAQLGTPRYFDGTIDDVRVYRQKLSPAEATRLAQAGRVHVATWQEVAPN